MELFIAFGRHFLVGKVKGGGWRGYSFLYKNLCFELSRSHRERESDEVISVTRFIGLWQIFKACGNN